MAFAAGSPDMHAHSLPAFGAGIPESGENITEALTALDTYKKKDPSKGTHELLHLCVLGASLMVCCEQSLYDSKQWAMLRS